MCLSLKHEGVGLEFGEAVGEEGFDGGEDEYAFFACEEDRDIFSGEGLKYVRWGIGAHSRQFRGLQSLWL